MVRVQADRGTLPDALPFYLALEPSPTDERIAVAVVRPGQPKGELGVSLIVADRSSELEVFRFSRLAPVCVAWSPSGRRLAFAQGSTLLIRNEDGLLRLGSLSDDVQWLGFDQNEQLWQLAGGTLTVASELTSICGVEAVVASGLIAYGRREQGGTCLYRLDGDIGSLLACVPGDHVTVKLSMRGAYLVAALASAHWQEQIAARVVRIHLTTGHVDTMLDRTLPCGFNAGPGLDASVATTGEVYAAFEDAPWTQLWQLGCGTEPKPVTPDGFEVFDFALNPAGNAVGVIASDTRQAKGTFERQLLVGLRTAGKWCFEPPIAGVHDMARWRADGALEILCGSAGWWRRVVYPDPGEARSHPKPFLCSVTSLSGPVELDLLRLPGSEHRRFGIILLPRLHQQFAAGAQSLFFHHQLFSIARGLGAEGYTVVTFSGPGAIGRGRRRRELSGAYLPALNAALNEIILMLRKSGCTSFGLLAGSLAAVPALRLLGPCSAFSAAAFVAPLLEASIPITTPVRNLLLDDPEFPTFDAAAANLAVPLRIVHGMQDEVAPFSQVLQLCQQAGDPSLVTLHALADEGHIFRSMNAWVDTYSELSSFLAALVRPDK
jgi:hypothetical protein